MAGSGEIVFKVTNQRAFVESVCEWFKGLNDFVRLTVAKLEPGSVTPPKVPDWVHRCFDHFWKVGFSKVSFLSTDKRLTLKELGFSVNYLEWLPHWVESALAVLPGCKIVGLSPAAEKKIDAAWSKVFLVDGFVTKKDLDDLAASKCPDSWGLTNLPDLPDDLSPSQSSQFYQGMAEGALGPSGDKDGEIRQTDATQIYLWMMIHWRTVIEMKSIKQLHAALQVVFGKNRGGDISRLQKLCQRVGLRLRPRGRPRK